MIKKSFQIALLFLLLCSCGSGTFENDPESWHKVFGEDTPENIEVLQSRFWKSAHWTYEFEFYCKLKADKTVLKDYFIDHYSMKKRDNRTTFHSSNKPNWFVKDLEGFEIWEKQFKMTLFINEQTEEVYLHCIQV